MKVKVKSKLRGCEKCHLLLTLEGDDGTKKSVVVDISGNAISAAQWGVMSAIRAINEMLGNPPESC
jgi:hypothetical protein